MKRKSQNIIKIIYFSQRPNNLAHKIIKILYLNTLLQHADFTKEPSVENIYIGLTHKHIGMALVEAQSYLKSPYHSCSCLSIAQG